MPAFQASVWTILINIALGILIVTLLMTLIRIWRLRPKPNLDELEGPVQERKDELTRLASELGLNYQFDRNQLVNGMPFASSYYGVDCNFSLGISNCNTLKGQIGNTPVLITEIVSPDGHKNVAWHRTWIRANVTTDLGVLVITPKGFSPALRNMDLGHEAFDQKFNVNSDNQALARDIITSQMMDYLLSYPDRRIEFDHTVIKIDKARKLSVDEIKEGLLFLERFLQFVPKNVSNNLK